MTMLQTVDARGFQSFASSQATSLLLFLAVTKPFGQAIFTRKSVSFQLLGDAVAPAGRNLIDGRLSAALAVTVDGIGRHHVLKIRNPKSEIRKKSKTRNDP